MRAGVFLEDAAMPYIHLYPDDTNGILWNANLYDFFKHGELKTLVSKALISGLRVSRNYYK